MAGDPAEIGSTPVDVAVVVVEDILVRHCGIDEIAAGGVHHALRFAGGAGCTDDEQRVFRVHFLWRAFIWDALGEFVVIVIAALQHLDRGAGAPDHDDACHRPGKLVQRSVHIGLQLHLAPAARALVCCHHDGAHGIGDAACQAFGHDTADDRRMDRADARAGEHGIDRLGDHRQVEGDAVALPDALRLQDVRPFHDMGVQFAIGDAGVILRVVPLPDDGDLVAPLGQMPVDAIIGDVGGALLEPLDRDLAPLE